MATDIDGASEKSWWDSFVDGVSELGGTWLNYDLAKEKNKANATVAGTVATTTTTTAASDRNMMLLIGGSVLLIALLLVVKK